MRDRDIDDLLRRAADAKPDVDPVVLDRISKSLGSDLQPVRPLPSAWVLNGSLVLLSVILATAGATLLGLHGLDKMNAVEIGMIFPVLGLFILLAATLCVAEAIPGSRRLVSPWALTFFGCIALAAVFVLLFHDYGTDGFVLQGVKCLAAGLAQAVPVALGIGWLLRRGFSVNRTVAAFSNGVLAGLAGVTMLELHCPNFEAPHVLVWHLAVVPLSGAIGMLVVWTLKQASSR